MLAAAGPGIVVMSQCFFSDIQADVPSSSYFLSVSMLWPEERPLPFP